MKEKIKHVCGEQGFDRRKDKCAACDVKNKSIVYWDKKEQELLRYDSFDEAVEMLID